MESVTKFLSGFAGGGVVSGFLLFIFKGQNRKISELDKKKVDVANCKIIEKNMDKTIDEIKVDIKDIKTMQMTQIETMTETKTMLSGIKDSMEKRRGSD